jgi:hypothetical protein
VTRTTDSSNRFSQSLRVRANKVLLYIHCCNFVFVIFFCFRTVSYLIHLLFFASGQYRTWYTVTIYFLLQDNIVPNTQLQFIFCFRTISYLIYSYNLFFVSGQYRTWYTVRIYFLFQANIVPDTQLQLFVFASGQYNLTWYTVTINFLLQDNIVPDTCYNLFFASGQYRTWYTLQLIFCFRTISYLIHSYNLFLFFRTIQSYLIHHYFLQRYWKKMKICGRMYK